MQNYIYPFVFYMGLLFLQQPYFGNNDTDAQQRYLELILQGLVVRKLAAYIV